MRRCQQFRHIGSRVPVAQMHGRRGLRAGGLMRLYDETLYIDTLRSEGGVGGVVGGGLWGEGEGVC